MEVDEYTSVFVSAFANSNSCLATSEYRFIFSWLLSIAVLVWLNKVLFQLAQDIVFNANHCIPRAFPLTAAVFLLLAPGYFMGT